MNCSHSQNAKVSHSVQWDASLVPSDLGVQGKKTNPVRCRFPRRQHGKALGCMRSHGSLAKSQVPSKISCIKCSGCGRQDSAIVPGRLATDPRGRDTNLAEDRNYSSLQPVSKDQGVI